MKKINHQLNVYHKKIQGGLTIVAPILEKELLSLVK